MDGLIEFETKDLIGIVLLVTATGLTAAGLLFSQRLREAAFFVMVAGAVLTTRLDINIFSAYWYRGTTRGFEVTFVDVLAVALLMSILINPLHGRERWFWPAGLAPLLLFTGYAAGSILFAEPKIFGLYELTKLVRGLVFFLAAACFVRGRRELAIVAVALSFAVCLEGATSIRQRYLGDIFRVTGTLQHANSLSMYLCLVTPVLIGAATSTLSAWVRWWCWLAVAVAVLTMLLTVSRAGIPILLVVAGGITALCVSWRLTPRRATVAALAAIGLTAMVAMSWDLVVARYWQASLTEEFFDETKEGRGYYFRQVAVILDDRPSGVGLNNWSYWVSKQYGAAAGMGYEDYEDIAFAPPDALLPMYRYAAPAHNIGVLVAGELGWAGLALFTLLWLRWFHMGAGFLRFRPPTDAVHRIGLGLLFGCGGIFLQSFTEWTFRQTQIFITFHILIGTLAALHHIRRTNATPIEEEWDWEWIEEPGASTSPEPVEVHRT